jgi:hypothetical protein
MSLPTNSCICFSYPAGAQITISDATGARAATACSISVRLPKVINALGSVAPNLSPLPAAAMMAAHWLICFPKYVENLKLN